MARHQRCEFRGEDDLQCERAADGKLGELPLCRRCVVRLLPHLHPAAFRAALDLTVTRDGQHRAVRWEPWPLVRQKEVRP